MNNLILFFSAKTLSKIETHLDTSNATEAWILLAMVAPNVQGHSPERISILLLESLKYDMVRMININENSREKPINLFTFFFHR